MRARSSRRPRSLAARLTLAVVCLTAVGLVTFGTAGTLLLERSLTGEVDNRLRTLPEVGRDNDRPPPGDRSQAPPFPTDLRSLTIGADGSVLESVGQSGSDSSLPDTSALDAEELRRREGEPFDLPSTSGGSDWRVLTAPGEDGTVHLVAHSLAGVDGTLRRLLLIEAVVGLAVVGALGFGAAAIVRLQLRPLREIEATAQAIAGGDLDRRVPAQE
ncbi:HAMP domain-containing protein, partial [Nocardiopsis sp. NPDC058631]|uniref:HAMP domain-containing protein n=1 Tax=Nocardiopsis sp. NPDC058631 TaxID=3346566 RepID=UPI0036620B83